MEEWLTRLENGDPEGAWDLFLARYRRLLFATIRNHARDYDEVMDVFTAVCEALRENDLARLRLYGSGGVHRARFSTWLVVVVRNLALDRLRAVHGRRRPPAAADRLPPLQRRIFDLVFVKRYEHREAYERIRSAGPDLSFGRFLQELAAVYRTVGWRAPRHEPTPGAGEPSFIDGAAVPERERREILDRALAALPGEDAAVVRLYVVEGVSAAEVARILALPNAKAVYNRVYRALAVLRARLEESGYRHAGDL